MWQFPPYHLPCPLFLKVKNRVLLVSLHRPWSRDLGFCLLPSGQPPVCPWLSYSAARKPRHAYHFRCRTERNYGIVLQTTLLTYSRSVGFACFNITTLLTQVQLMTLTVSLDSLLQHCCQARRPSCLYVEKWLFTFLSLSDFVFFFFSSQIYSWLCQTHFEF